MSLLLVGAGAVLIVAWLTAAATAVRSVSRIWLRHWVEQGARGSDAVSLYLERPQRLLLAAGTATMLTAVLTGIAMAAAPADGIVQVALRLLVTAAALLFLGQLLPRAVARRWGVGLVPVLVPVLRLADLVLGPLADAVRRLAGRRAAPAGGHPAAEQRDALDDLLREGALEGVSAGEEAAIISGIVQFGDRTAGDVMTPRADMFVVDGALPRDELARRVAQSGYSRVPVYEGSPDELVGMVHVFDLIKASGGRPLRWRPLAFTPADAFCNDLLARMLRGQLHLVVVRDAAGRTLGLVTLEDLLEELVGEIRDEHDEPQAPTPPAPQPDAAAGAQAERPPDSPGAAPPAGARGSPARAPHRP